jgi:glycosyltransferase involved in cell wall biosynthesis
MKTIFLESHNINNPYTGFGQFNLHLLKGFHNCKDPDLKFVVHTPNIRFLKRKFGNFFSYKYYIGLRRYSHAQIRKRYDVWHSMNQNTKIEPARDLPYVLTIHDVNFFFEISNDLEHPRNILFKNKLARAKAITYISEFARKQTHDCFEIPNIPEYVIHNGNPSGKIMDLSHYKPQFKMEQDYFFTIGDFRERKNFHLLVRMMQYLKGYKLIIAGNTDRPYAAEVRKIIDDLNLNERVLLPGKISEEEKQYHLKNCTALLFPSLMEGFGLPPIEAMTFGTPVFLANTTSLPEIGGEYAFYWNDFEPENMAHELLDGLTNYRNNKEQYQHQLKKQAAKFNWDRAAEQYIEVYKSIL